MPPWSARGFLASLLAMTLALVAAPAPVADPTGVYENAGVSVLRAAASETVSFQGLVELNFEFPLTRVLHSDVDRFIVRETPLFFRIECRDRQNRITWSRRWEKGVTCTLGADRLDLFVRPPALKDDAYLLTLFPMKEKGVLLVEVQRVNATTLGPSVKPMGSYVFARRDAD